MKSHVISYCQPLMAMALFATMGMSCGGSDNITATQVKNRPPAIQQIVGSTDWSASTADRITCRALDPDGDKLTYTWTADNGTITGSGEAITWTSPATMGKYKIKVTVSDGKGGETQGALEARVIMNADGTTTPDAPVLLKLTIPSSDNVTAAKRVRTWTASAIECIITGSESKDLKYIWTSANGKLQAGKGMSLENGTASKVNWIAPGVGGDFAVDVIVSDGSGHEAKGTVNFKVFCCGN